MDQRCECGVCVDCQSPTCACDCSNGKAEVIKAILVTLSDFSLQQLRDLDELLDDYDITAVLNMVSE